MEKKNRKRNQQTKEEYQSLLSTKRLNEVVCEHLYLVQHEIQHHWINVYESFALNCLECSTEPNGVNDLNFFRDHFFKVNNWQSDNIMMIPVPQLNNVQVCIEKRLYRNNMCIRLLPCTNINYNETKRLRSSSSAPQAPPAPRQTVLHPQYSPTISTKTMDQTVAHFHHERDNVSVDLNRLDDLMLNEQKEYTKKCSTSLYSFIKLYSPVNML